MKAGIGKARGAVVNISSIAGVTATLVRTEARPRFEEAIRPETRLVFAEILGNPGLEVLDGDAVANRREPDDDHESNVVESAPAPQPRVWLALALAG